MSGKITKVLNQPVITDFSDQPTSIESDYQGQLLVVAGSGGLNFQAGSSTIGGAVFVEGGANTIAGGPVQATRTSANGGLQGNWVVDTGGGQNDVWLATGNDVVLLGGNDTIHAGGQNVLIDGTGAGKSLDVFVGPGNVTVFGGKTSGDLIHADGLPTGTDYLAGGSGGNNTITAGAGTTTLFGGGSYSLIEAAGDDTINPGHGHDTVALSSAVVQAGSNESIIDWKRNDILELQGYDISKNQWSPSPFGSTLTLSDGTSITFEGIHPSKVHIVSSSSG
jgi:hypothetical protein